MRSSTRAHYVSHNAVTRIPRSYIYLDTEAHRTEEGPRERQTFRLAVAAFDTVNKHKDGWRERDWCRARDPLALWTWVTARCRAKARTVLVAHNLAYDLRISDAFRHLPALGWEFVAGRVDDGKCWMMFRNDGRTLCCVDSTSWCPVSLERLGEAVGIRKVELPDEDDTEEAWFERCVRDVEILAEVWRRLMRWVEDDDLGNWKFSGAGQSWAAYRHRFMSHKLLVHDNEAAREAERAAALTGRTEAWKHGNLTDGPYTEWDFYCAYATIGADSLVPTTLVGELNKPNLVNVLTASLQRAVLVECEVTTDVPTVPCRGVEGIRWPVGTFKTTLWDNELALGIDGGAVVHVDRAWLYRRTPALQEFCRWVLDGLEGRRGIIDPVVLVALKHWSRALIGRTAARWSRWETAGKHPDVDVSLMRCFDAGTEETWQLMQLGTQLVRQVGTPDNPDVMAAIMSWVMAECRVRLWGAMQAAGCSNVVYVDTDSLIVGPAGSSALRDARIAGLRVKGEWRSIEILGPRQIAPGGVLRAAGVPRGAVKVGRNVYEAEVWSGLSRSLGKGESDSVSVERRRFELHGHDKRRIHLRGHETAPIRLGAGAVDLRSTA